jgi:hypothetical protein
MSLIILNLLIILAYLTILIILLTIPVFLLLVMIKICTLILKVKHAFVSQVTSITLSIIHVIHNVL